MSRDRISRDWYKPLAKDFTCNDHPRPNKKLIVAVSIQTGMSQELTSHVLDRLRHLCYCIQEPSEITLFRLQPGKHQLVKERPDWTQLQDDELPAVDGAGDGSPDDE